MMNRLDRYILREFLQKFALFFIAVVALLFFSDLYTNLRHFLVHHATYGQVFCYYGMQCVAFFPLTLPLTFCTTLLFVFCTMHKRHEIIALLTSGISFLRTMRMFWLLACSTSLGILVSDFWLVPQAQKYSQHCLDQIFHKNRENNFLQHLSLSGDQRLWYINRYDKISGQAFDLAVHEYDFRGNEYRRITAKWGSFDRKNCVWEMQNGQEIFLDPLSPMAQKIENFSKRIFENFHESPETMEIMQMDAHRLSLPQLRQAITYEKSQKTIDTPLHILRFWDIIFHAFSCCLFTVYALLILFIEPRTNLLKNVTKLVLLVIFFLVFSLITYALGENGAIHWFLAAGFPFFIALIPPLFGIKKFISSN
jgi:lipopolysaccharide export system permease protein